MDQYLSEQVFRYNNRPTKDNKITDSDRFPLAMSQVAGKRLTNGQTDGQGYGQRVPPGGGDGVRGTVLALVLAARRLWFRLSFGIRYLAGLKNSRSQLLKVLASLRAFVVFVFHIHHFMRYTPSRVAIPSQTKSAAVTQPETPIVNLLRQLQ